MPAIETQSLTKRYGQVDALADMTVRVDRGELYGFLGPNGAGKSTTIRVLTGQIRPDSGTARVLEVDPVDEPIEIRRRVGILPEQGSPPSFLTPREYLQFAGRVREMDPDVVAERTDAWADRLGLHAKLDALSTDLSRGQQQKVMIAQAFLHEPDLVFIDEPLSNLDPIVQERVKRHLRKYAGEHTVFVSTHNIEVAESVCTRVGIVSDGRVIAEHDVDELDAPLLEVFLEEVDVADPRDTPRRDVQRTVETEGSNGGAEADADATDAATDVGATDAATDPTTDGATGPSASGE